MPKETDSVSNAPLVSTPFYSEPTQRPMTPVQGTRAIPWEPYSKLSDNHPVFLLSAKEREEMYAKGVDPVVYAECNRRLLLLRKDQGSGTVKKGIARWKVMFRRTEGGMGWSGGTTSFGTC